MTMHKSSMILATLFASLSGLVWAGEIHEAALRGDFRAVASLIEENPAVVNALLSEGIAQGYTPLHFAAAEGHISIAELLIEKGADVNRKDQSVGFGPLHMAAREGRKEMAELLIARGAKVNLKSRFKRTPLDIAAREGHDTFVVVLLKNGAEVNAQADDGLSPLHWCALEGRTSVAKVLLEYGANLELRAGGKTALQLAKERGHENVAELLREHESKK